MERITRSFRWQSSTDLFRGQTERGTTVDIRSADLQWWTSVHGRTFHPQRSISVRFANEIARRYFEVRDALFSTSAALREKKNNIDHSSRDNEKLISGWKKQEKWFRNGSNIALLGFFSVLTAIIANDFTLAYFNLSFGLTSPRLSNNNVETVQPHQDLLSSPNETSAQMSVNNLEQDWTTSETNTIWSE